MPLLHPLDARYMVVQRIIDASRYIRQILLKTEDLDYCDLQLKEIDSTIKAIDNAKAKEYLFKARRMWYLAKTNLQKGYRGVAVGQLATAIEFLAKALSLL